MELVGFHASSISSLQLRSTRSVAALRDPSTQLEDVSLLRGVRASALMARCGWLLTTPQRGWQYAMTEEESDALYATSHEVDSLDWFISHSWSDSRWLKYIALGWFLNYKASLMFAKALSLVFLLIQLFGVPLSQQTDSSLDDLIVSLEDAIGRNHTECERVRVDCQRKLQFGHAWKVHVLGFMFCLIFRTSHTSCSPEANFFLDKACIHQTDPERKARGILNLGGFLRKSHRMLLLWSPDYFDRLWCNYELACFVTLAGVEKVDVMPLWAPSFAICLLLHYSLDRALHECFFFDQSKFVVGILALVLLCIPFLRAARLRAELRQQLEKFDWSRARCFCCDVGHKLPETGASIPCDREFVERNIMTWFQELSTLEETGIQSFERCVRDHVGSNVRRLVGPIVVPLSAVAAYVSVRVLGCIEDCFINPHAYEFLLAYRVIDLHLEVLACLVWQGIAGYKHVPNKRSCCSWVGDILLGSVMLITFSILEGLVVKVALVFVLDGRIWQVLLLCVCIDTAGVSLYRALS